MPVDEAKERELLRYVARGGRLMSLNDPLVAALSPGLFSPLSLRLPEGLTVDQSMSWAGTRDSFVLSADFPAHPSNLGQREPVIFPLAGAVFVRDISAPSSQDPPAEGEAPQGSEGSPSGDGDEAPGAAGGDEAPAAAGSDEAPATAGGDEAPAAAGGDEAPSAAGGDEAPSAAGNDEAPSAAGGGEAPAAAGNDEAPATAGGGEAPWAAEGGGAASDENAPGAADGVGEILGHTWAVAITSPAAFLETDRASVGRGEPRFDRGSDPHGPLVLASATSVVGGGRLVLAADSDFASNAYIGFAGNLDFATGLLSWLVGDEDDLAAPRRGTTLAVSDSVARALFWGPTVFWPLLILSVWGAYFLRRRRSSA
jgi:hypothetical protein